MLNIIIDTTKWTHSGAIIECPQRYKDIAQSPRIARFQQFSRQSQEEQQRRMDMGKYPFNIIK